MANSLFGSLSYYRDRERTERALADQAASPATRDIHLEIAELYRELAALLETPARLQSPVELGPAELGSVNGMPTPSSTNLSS